MAPFVGGLLTSDELMIEADLAMYDAKGRGGDRVGIAEPGSRRRAEAEARLSWSQWVRDPILVRLSSSAAEPSEELTRTEFDRIDRDE